MLRFIRTCALQSSCPAGLIRRWRYDGGSSVQPAAGALGARSPPNVRSSRRYSRDGAARCGVDLPYWSGTQALAGLSRVSILQPTSGPAAWPSTQPEWREATPGTSDR